MTSLALEIPPERVYWINRHMTVVCCVHSIAVGKGKITPLVSIATACPSVALEAVCPHWLVDGLDCLVKGHRRHGNRIRHKNTVDLFPFVSCLVADKAINICKLGLRGCCFWQGAKTGMAIPATGPVAEYVYSVCIESRMQLSLDARSVRDVLGMPLPLVMLRGVERSSLSIVALETHR